MPRTTYELTCCPVCDSRNGVTVADAETMRLQTERLWAFHQRRLRPGVPIESLRDRLLFSQYPPLRLSRCLTCTHVYRNPWETRHALEEAYNDPTLGDATLGAFLNTQRDAFRAQVQRLNDVTGHPGRGIEVGSYAGGFLAAARERGWSFSGVDVSQRAADFAARQGLQVIRGELPDLSVEERSLDVVAIWNTFEQLYDVRAVLLAARRMLRPGGVFVVRVPNADFFVSWSALLHRTLVAGVATCVLAHNNLLGFPYRQAFTKASIEKLLASHRLEVVKIFGDTLVPIADRWTTKYGAIEERLIKRTVRALRTGWSAPWVEVYARATG